MALQMEVFQIIQTSRKIVKSNINTFKQTTRLRYWSTGNTKNYMFLKKQNKLQQTILDFSSNSLKVCIHYNKENLKFHKMAVWSVSLKNMNFPQKCFFSPRTVSYLKLSLYKILGTQKSL